MLQGSLHGGGAPNPLGRVAALQRATRDPRIPQRLCQHAGGFFIPKPGPIQLSAFSFQLSPSALRHHLRSPKGAKDNSPAREERAPPWVPRWTGCVSLRERMPPNAIPRFEPMNRERPRRSAPVPGRSNAQKTAGDRANPRPTPVRILLRPGTGALRFMERAGVRGNGPFHANPRHDSACTTPNENDVGGMRVQRQSMNPKPGHAASAGPVVFINPLRDGIKPASPPTRDLQPVRNTFRINVFLPLTTWISRSSITTVTKNLPPVTTSEKFVRYYCWVN